MLSEHRWTIVGLLGVAVVVLAAVLLSANIGNCLGGFPNVSFDSTYDDSRNTLTVHYESGQELQPETEPDGDGGTLQLLVRIYGEYPTRTPGVSYTDVRWIDAYGVGRSNAAVVPGDSITVHNVEPNRTVDVEWIGYTRCENSRPINQTLYRREF
jgi:hypothetical protein